MADQKMRIRSGTPACWLVGDKCTYADLAFVPWNVLLLTRLFPDDGVDFEHEYPLFWAWHQRLAQRPTVERIINVREECTRTMEDTAKPVLPQRRQCANPSSRYLEQAVRWSNGWREVVKNAYAHLGSISCGQCLQVDWVSTAAGCPENLPNKCNWKCVLKVILAPFSCFTGCWGECQPKTPCDCTLASRPPILKYRRNETTIVFSMNFVIVQQRSTGYTLANSLPYLKTQRHLRRQSIQERPSKPVHLPT